MICKEIPKVLYCHIGGFGTWGGGVSGEGGVLGGSGL